MTAVAEGQVSRKHLSSLVGASGLLGVGGQREREEMVLKLKAHS